MLLTPNLVSWQYAGYPKNHAHKLNLILHIITAPIFIASTLSLIAHLILMQWIIAAASFGGMVFVVIVQGIGHGREAVKPDPFQSPLDFFARFFTENFFTFWRYVFSGQWSAQLSRKG
jgi:hypothetical protein